jgi:hypothetical protein
VQIVTLVSAKHLAAGIGVCAVELAQKPLTILNDELYCEDLLADWNLAVEGREVFWIDPLK